MKKTFAITSLTMILFACSSGHPNNEDMHEGQLLEETQTVSTQVVATNTFFDEVVSNGKAMAFDYADIYWEVDGAIENILTQNGQKVEKGMTIATLNDFRLNNNLESANASLKNVKLQMYEAIIGQGYSPDSLESIPPKVVELAQVKSGYLQALANYKSAQYNMEHSKAIAPISGIVANLTSRPSNRADLSRPLCRIIDTRSMHVEFTVIESELNIIKVGNIVEIEAFSMPGKLWTGHISEINPSVGSNGMIRVLASIDSPDGIFEGMNLSVKVRQEAGMLLSVPKSAVVMRSNRPVVFVAHNGKAQWCYVETSVENSGQIAITAGINEGDSVIVSGNEFLAHNSKIIVKQ